MPNRHHILVRLAHACNIPLLLGLSVSGLAIYWASPVYHPAGQDPLAIAGRWVCYLFLPRYPHPEQWVYNVFSLGPYQLAAGLRLHWLFAYLFMAVGVLYGTGLWVGGGWRDIWPRRSDGRAALAMSRYYIGRLLRRSVSHPPETDKYNALQRLAYFSMPVCGALAVLSGWALHKPQSWGALAFAFGGYPGARVWHFWLLWIFVLFTVPHVILTLGEGWGTLRSMVTGGAVPAPPGHSRRAFLVSIPLYAAVWGAFYWLLPDETRGRLLGRTMPSNPAREALLNRVLSFDDDVAEAIFSPTRSVPTYAPQEATTDLRNNYAGQTPDGAYLETWKLHVSGLADGRDLQLGMADLARFTPVEQVTRLVCVEGWSAIAWWGGFRFSEFLAAYPPIAGTRYVRLDSAVNVDGRGAPDPYYVALDLETAGHPQTLLATHQGGRPLTLEHGAPLRLVVPMKLGLKNIKAITGIAYTVDVPADYWNERGYSQYDGL